MRTKKTYIKDSVITRTIPMTRAVFVSVDMETMTATEDEVILTLSYDKDEAKKALEEMGRSVAGVKSVEVFEVKASMETSTFLRYANI